ncbi:MAG TPA: FAD-binding oxidoreductase [Sphingomonas sp.]
MIGAGIVGASAALALQDSGHTVTLIDPEADVRGASWGNAGHIAVEQIEPLASRAALKSVPRRLLDRNGALCLPVGAIRHWLPFGVRMARAASPARMAAGTKALTALLDQAMPAWRRLAARLGDPALLREDGHYIVWDSIESGSKGRANWTRLEREAARFRNLTSLEWLELGDLLGGRLADAVRCVGSGRITDHRRLFQAIERAFVGSGGVRLTGTAGLRRAEDGTVSVRMAGGATLVPDYVLLAAGVAARALAERIGLRVPMIAERGYHVQAPASRWPIDMPPIVFEDRSMIVTRFERTVRASSFVEFADPDRPPNPARWRGLRERIRDLRLPFDPPGSEWMGARPTLPDYLPAIGRSRHAPNLLYAFGHQHLGLTLGPITAEIVSALAAGRAPPVDITPFDLARFS